MYSEIAIRVEALNKCYHIYNKPQDRLKQFILPRIRCAIGKTPKQYFQEFWAIKDVSFEVKRGETFGIIGRNGSGKSTLLQLICGILNPTSGNIDTKGRIAALLELGSGFNPEFSGRENVYMNAALLGLNRNEIDQRFSDIESFADIGEFMEQPVKTYSSGMFVRLAFAVIANVDADILVIDEALSVGDAVFTQKCMRFIRSFQEKGTLLFVSHDMASVKNLCNSAIWLNSGRIMKEGSSKSITEEYMKKSLQEIYGKKVFLKDLKKNLRPDIEDNIDKKKKAIDYNTYAKVNNNVNTAKGWYTGSAEVKKVYMESAEGHSISILEGGENVRLVICAQSYKNIENPIIGFIFKDKLGQDLFGENTLSFTSLKKTCVFAGQSIKAIFCFQLPMLPNGQYAVVASIAEGNLHDHVQHHWLHDALIITVSSSNVRWGLVGVPFDHVSLAVDESCI